MSPEPGVLKTTAPLWVTLNAISGRARANRETHSTQCERSVAEVPMNLSRAGVLKNRFATSTVVPGGQPTGPRHVRVPPSSEMLVPSALSGSRVVIFRCATAPMLGSASPRKPIVAMRCRSSSPPILLVAKRCTARGTSSGGIPWPLSMTRISFVPPSASSTSMRVAPASIEFSTSSLTMLAGRSTTSPAAMRLARSSDRT